MKAHKVELKTETTKVGKDTFSISYEDMLKTILFNARQGLSTDALMKSARLVAQIEEAARNKKKNAKFPIWWVTEEDHKYLVECINSMMWGNNPVGDVRMKLLIADMITYVRACTAEEIPGT